MARVSLRLRWLALLLSLGVLAVFLDVQLTWRAIYASKRVFRRTIQALTKVAQSTSEESQLVQTLNQLAQNTSQSRGLVIPVYEPTIKLAASLVLELRTMGVDWPVEMPHCGDLTVESQELMLQKPALGSIRLYDVCERAASTNVANSAKKLFCADLDACHLKFRAFEIKILAVVYSLFEEVMMIDADTTFFVNPTVLWDSDKYQSTGTLLMNDRISHDIYWMAERVGGDPEISVQREYLANFDVAPFHSLPTIARGKASLANMSPVMLNFEPSDFLLSSHSWNLRSGHQVDSSLVLWNKKRQPRATAILASFMALNDVASPPSYGDKELYFYAAELAETQYSVSDHAIGAVGTDFRDYGEKNSTLCGDMAQVFPLQPTNESDDVPLFYLNSDRILYFRPVEEPVYYMKARPAEFYPGAFGERRMECPFGISVGKLSQAEEEHLSGRQRLHQITVEWEEAARLSKDDPTRRKEMDAATDGKLDVLMHEMRDTYRRNVATRRGDV
ncbi:hypothetical protein BBJ28_00005141 [Nothophytophthora sp. Chile5]|nr:hypothetical protein BBJ28_00005141 [Nothophytophthora sp. Chile5]